MREKTGLPSPPTHPCPGAPPPPPPHLPTHPHTHTPPPPTHLPHPPQDRSGDGALGVQTLPVVLGPRAALAVGLAPLAACAALGAHAALRGAGLAWSAWPAHAAWLEPALRCAALAAVAWNLAQPTAAAWQVRCRPPSTSPRRLLARGRLASPCCRSVASCLCFRLLHHAPPCLGLQVLRSGFDRDRVSAAIAISMKSVGLGTLLLAVLA